MPNIPIVDGYGLDLQAALNPDSAFAKYFKQPPSFSVVKQDLASLQTVSLAQFPLKSTQIGLSFGQPNALGAAGAQFTGANLVAGTLCVVTAGSLFDPDPYENPIEIPAGHAYVGLGIEAAISQGISLPTGNLKSGFTVGASIRMTHYKCFETTATTPTFRAALEASLQNFVLPFRVEDLSALAVADVVTLEGAGSLQLCGSVDLLTAVNPLASISSPVLPGGIQATGGAAVNVTASYKIEGDFQIRIQKIDSGTVRMGVYRKRGTDFCVQVTPSVGVSAGTTNVDFISTVLNAIGPDPFPPADQLEQAGLTEERQQAVVGALQAAVQRRLELGVEADLQALSSSEAVFLYEVSLRDLGPEGSAAVQDALRLNLSTLLKSPGSLPRGIREIQSLLTTTRTKGHTLKFNVLGIYNGASINDLTLKGTILTDAASGEILITDTATATQVSGNIDFLADADKLRKVLAQSFLITAAYRCSGLIAHAPSLKVSYWHFAAHAKTSHQTLAGYLDALQAFGLITEPRKQAALAGTKDTGRSTFYLDTGYDDALSQSLYLRSDGQPRGIEEYERIGREALRQFLHPGDDDFRLRDLESDSLWEQVKATGGTVVNLAPLYPGLRSNNLQIALIAGDYVLIAWWASTMSDLAKALSDANRFFSQQPPPAPDSPAFKKVQADLWHRMADVASKTHDRFSDPWGLLAMDLASGQRSKASARIVSPALTLRLERPQPPGSAG